jgi:cytochrome bd-type quinol oxidase subunit 2
MVSEVMMPEDKFGPFEFRLTLLQMMKLVIIAAVVSLCLTPMTRLAMAGVVPWDFLLMGAAVAVPLLGAIVAFPLVRKGPGKDRLIRMLLFASTCAGLVVAIYPLILPSTIWARTGAVVQTLYFVIGLLAGPFLILLASLSKMKSR